MDFAKTNTENERKLFNWLEETTNTLDTTLDGDIEDVFAVSGKYSNEVDEIYNNILELYQLIVSLKSNVLESLNNQS